MADSTIPAKMVEALHTGVVTAIGSMYKWIIATLLTVHGAAIVGLSQQSASHYLLMQRTAGWFGFGLFLVMVSAFAAFLVPVTLVSVLGREDGLPDRMPKALIVLLIFTFLGPLASMATLLEGGRAVLETLPAISAPCHS